MAYFRGPGRSGESPSGSDSGSSGGSSSVGSSGRFRGPGRSGGSGDVTSDINKRDRNSDNNSGGAVSEDVFYGDEDYAVTSDEPSLTGGQAAARKAETDYLNTAQGADSFYRAMNLANRGNTSDVELSKFMDSLGIGYDRRSPLLGGLDALATGRGGFGDAISQAFNSLSSFVPGLGLFNTLTDSLQRIQNNGVIGGNMLTSGLIGLGANPLLSQVAGAGLNMFHGAKPVKELTSLALQNAGNLASMAGFSPAASMSIGVGAPLAEDMFGEQTRSLF